MRLSPAPLATRSRVCDPRPSQAGCHIRLGADKAYTVTAFVKNLRERQVTPHIAIDGRVSNAASCARPPSMPHHPPSRIPGEPNLPQTDRRGVRLDQGAGQPREGQGSRVRQGRGGLHPRGRRLQPHPHPQTPGAMRNMKGGQRKRSCRQHTPTTNQKRKSKHSLNARLLQQPARAGLPVSTAERLNKRSRARWGLPFLERNQVSRARIAIW